MYDRWTDRQNEWMNNQQTDNWNHKIKCNQMSSFLYTSTDMYCSINLNQAHVISQSHSPSPLWLCPFYKIENRQNKKFNRSVRSRLFLRYQADKTPCQIKSAILLQCTFEILCKAKKRPVQTKYSLTGVTVPRHSFRQGPETGMSFPHPHLPNSSSASVEEIFENKQMVRSKKKKKEREIHHNVIKLLGSSS